MKNGDDTTFIPLERLTEPESDKLPVLGPVLEARVGLLEDPREARILRARYLTDSPVALRLLADEFGISVGRVHQLEQRAIGSFRDMLPQRNLEELAEFYLGNQGPPAVNVGNALHYKIDDWLDALKELFPWATQSDRLIAHRIADQQRSEASDFNLHRVKAALDDGLTVAEAADRLGLPLDAVEHLRQLIDWRYGHETRYTLTEAGLEIVEGGDDVTEAA